MLSSVAPSVEVRIVTMRSATFQSSCQVLPGSLTECLKDFLLHMASNFSGTPHTLHPLLSSHLMTSPHSPHLSSPHLSPPLIFSPGAEDAEVVEAVGVEEGVEEGVEVVEGVVAPSPKTPVARISSK